jgi:hypothetical protein
MSFERILGCLGLVSLLSTGLVGCGHKAPPIPPAPENPARTADLAVHQRGQAAVLSFTYPQTTVAGELLEELERVELWKTEQATLMVVGADETDDLDEAPGSQTEAGAEASMEAPELEGEAADQAVEVAEGAAPEGDQASDEEAVVQPLEVLAAADPTEFNSTARLVDTLNAAAIEKATDGDKLTLLVDLGEASHEERAHTFAVKTYASEKLPSAFSNLATLVQRVPPPPPTDFQVIPEASGIRLTWAELQESEEERIAIRIYRRSAQSRLYGQPLTRLPGNAIEHLDRSAVFGERYIYAVTALGHENPIAESFFGGEREIDYADRFAPAPPANLIALAEAGRVRLLWDASTEDDVVGYVVFRRQAAADFLRLNDEPTLDVEYSDRTVEAGTTYDYRVSAVDRIGNQSEPSASVIARVP